MSKHEEKHELMGRMPKGNHGGHHDWVSRDYAEIDCHATGCWFNRNGQCSVPSRCEISEDGRCKGFKVPPAEAKLDGD